MNCKKNSFHSAFSKYQKKIAVYNNMESKKAIVLGETEKGSMMNIELNKLTKCLETHMHIIGPTGCGKSRLILHLFREMITNLPDASFVLIDPKGDLYRQALQFCLAHNLAERLVIFDPSDNSNVVGFNPLFAGNRNPAFVMSGVVEAIRAAWKQDDYSQTPQMLRWLQNAVYALVRANATFLETADILSISNSWLRNLFVSKLGVEQEIEKVIKDEWENFGKLSLPRRQDSVNSSYARIRSFCLHPTIVSILGRKNKTLNMREITEGKIFLVNLERYRSLEPDQVYLLGTLLINDLVRTVFAKNESERNPVYLFIDEFEHFATRDLIPVLEEGRSFKLHLILAHQSLNQLKRKDPDIYDAVLTNARSKIIFGGLTNYDLEVLAPELYTTELDTNKIKDEIKIPMYEPIETQRIVPSFSESEQSSFSKTKTSGITQEENYSVSFQFGKGENNSLTISESTVETESEAETKMKSVMRAKAKSESESESEGQGLSSLDSSSFGRSYSLPELFENPRLMGTWSWQDMSAEGASSLKSRGRASGTSDMEGEGESIALTQGRSLAFQEGKAKTAGHSSNWNLGTNKGESKGITETEGKTESESYGKTRSYSITPFHSYKKQEVVTSRTFKNIEEQLFEKMQFLKGLKQREYVLKIPEKSSLKLTTPYVEPTSEEKSLTEANTRELKRIIFENTGYYSSPEEIKEERQKQLTEWKQEYNTIIEMEKKAKEEENEPKDYWKPVKRKSSKK